MAGINDYSNTAGSNTTINGIDIAEGCSPAGINNAIRQLMADIADMDDGVVPLQTPDINGGTIDGATIGGSSTIDNSIIGGTTPAAGTFTTLTANTSITGTLNTAAQTNITSVGTLSALTVSGDLTVDTDTLYVDSTNNRVGIGTASPSDTLEVKIGSANTTGVLIHRDNASGGGGIDFSNTSNTVANINAGSGTLTLEADPNNASGGSYISFKTDASEAMRIDSSGNVGIGTSSPLGKLHIQDSSAANTQITIENTSAATSTDYRIVAGKVGVSNEGFSIYDSANTTTAYYIDSSGNHEFLGGNVGIGTSSPATTLDVQGGNITQGDTGSNAGRLLIDNTTDTIQRIKVSRGGSTGQLAFHTGTDSEAMRITSSGQIGIGTSSPNGIAEFKTTGDTNLFITAGNANSSQLVLGDTDDIDVGKIRYRHNINRMEFTVNASERMVIDSSGNVGIGTTTTSSAKLNIQPNSAYLRIKEGRVDATNNVRLEAGGTVNTYLEYRGYLGHIWDVDSTEAMRIDSSGSLFVGLSSSAITSRFHSRGAGLGSGTWTINAENSNGNQTFGIRDDGYMINPQTYNATTASAENVHVSSAGYFFRSTSSRRYKNTINDATKGLDYLCNLRPVTFKGNDTGDKLFYGLIAEEVDEVGLSEFVDYNEDNQPDAVQYSRMVSLCIKAIQELKADNDALRTRIETIENA